jgi:hypothetical protein
MHALRERGTVRSRYTRKESTMAITLQKARRYCSASEIELIHLSTKKMVAGMTPSRLLLKLKRARKLRDKYRDLASRQHREARGKADPRRRRASTTNEATRLKHEVFAETVERFEAALDAASTKAKPVAKKKVAAKKTSKKTSKKTAKKASKKVASSKVKQTKVALMQAAGAAKPKTAFIGGKPATTARKKKVAKKAAAKVAESAWNESMVTRSEQSQGMRNARSFGRSGQTRTNAHSSSRGRRNQARRDSKG